MTRTYIESPVWTWKCDRCGRTSGDLARSQRHLPTPEDMRLRGWFIAEVHGDLCSRCKEGIDFAPRPNLRARVEAVEAVLVDHGHADTCGSELGDYPCSCWQHDLRAALASAPEGDRAGQEGEA